MSKSKQAPWLFDRDEIYRFKAEREAIQFEHVRD